MVKINSSNKLKSFDIEDSSKKSSHHDELSSQISLKIDPALLTRINLGNNKLDKINPSVFDLPNLIYLNVEINLLKHVLHVSCHLKQPGSG